LLIRFTSWPKFVGTPETLATAPSHTKQTQMASRNGDLMPPKVDIGLIVSSAKKMPGILSELRTRRICLNEEEQDITTELSSSTVEHSGWVSNRHCAMPFAFVLCATALWQEFLAYLRIWARR
ncbi:hypothetical protein GPALN_011958, partial [Globodera pallida]